MEVAVNGRHVEVSEKLRRQAASKIEHLERYLHGMERAELRFSDAKLGHFGDPVTCEITMTGHGHVVRAQAVGATPDAALEAVVDRAAQRLTKLKTKLVGRSRPRHKVAKVELDEVREDEEPIVALPPETEEP